MSERKLSTLRVIEEVKRIEGADRIVAYRVGGWWVIDQIGKYAVGDTVIYAEPDSWIPNEIAPFLSKGKEPREYNGILGEKLRTIRMKGQVSQGLIIPISSIPKSDFQKLTDQNGQLKIGECLDEILGIVKWEAPIPVQLAGTVKGNFPSHTPKTDQERVQNLSDADIKGTWEVSEKLEGTSFTAYLFEGEFGVCSRNLDLKCDENNLYWKIAIQEEIERKMRTFQFMNNFSIQGEIIGEGVQGNIYGLKGQHLYIYDIYDIDNGSYLDSKKRLEIVTKLDLKSVPILGFRGIESESIHDLIALADGYSKLNPSVLREGLVFKNLDDSHKSFKAISNEYLIKQK